MRSYISGNTPDIVYRMVAGNVGSALVYTLLFFLSVTRGKIYRVIYKTRQRFTQNNDIIASKTPVFNLAI